MTSSARRPLSSLVARALEPRAAEVDVGVADGVGEQVVRRVAARERLALAPARSGPARARRRSGSSPRRMRCSCSSARAFFGLSRSCLGLEDGPARGEDDEHREEHDDEPVEPQDGRGSPGARGPPRPVGDEQEQGQQDEVGQDGGAAVGDERQRHAGERDHLRHAARRSRTPAARRPRSARWRAAWRRSPGPASAVAKPRSMNSR